jgi:site-specific recombinase XerD
MELHQLSEGMFILLDKQMRLVQPVNEYLDYQALRGRAANTLRAYAKGLKIFFEFLEQRGLQYDRISLSMIREYVEHLRSPDESLTFLHVESKRSPATINRMVDTLHGFYCYHAAMHSITNPLIMKDVNNHNSVFRSMLYHAFRYIYDYPVQQSCPS